MDDAVLFISAYKSVHSKAPTWPLRNLRQVFLSSNKENIHSLLKRHHLSYIAAGGFLTSVDEKVKTETHYDYIHQKTTFSFEPQNPDKSNYDMSSLEGSAFYINLLHAQSVLLDDQYFKIQFIVWLAPFLVWINDRMYQIDSGAFMMNHVWFIIFEIIDYKTGETLTKDDVGAKVKNYNLLPVEKYQFFDEQQPTDTNWKISKIIYNTISDFTWELTNKCFRSEGYSFVHDIVVFSNRIENIPDYFCKLIGVKTPVSLIKDISTVETYEYYPQDGCSVISHFDPNEFHAVLYPAIILETLKLYIHIFQISNLEGENNIHKLIRNDIYLQNLFCAPNLPIETLNMLNDIRGSESYKKSSDALRLKTSYLTVQNDLKKSRNSTILNILLYIISLLGAIGTLDVLETHLGIPFKYSFIAVILLFMLGLIWWVVEYWNNSNF